MISKKYNEQMGNYIAKLTRESKPMTNADRIRQMTDEELANVLASVETGVNTYGDDVFSHWLSWLKAPADKEETE